MTARICDGSRSGVGVKCPPFTSAFHRVGRRGKVLPIQRYYLYQFPAEKVLPIKFSKKCKKMLTKLASYDKIGTVSKGNRVDTRLSNHSPTRVKKSA